MTPKKPLGGELHHSSKRLLTGGVLKKSYYESFQMTHFSILAPPIPLRLWFLQRKFSLKTGFSPAFSLSPPSRFPSHPPVFLPIGGSASHFDITLSCLRPCISPIFSLWMAPALRPVLIFPIDIEEPNSFVSPTLSLEHYHSLSIFIVSLRFRHRFNDYPECLYGQAARLSYCRPLFCPDILGFSPLMYPLSLL